MILWMNEDIFLNVIDLDLFVMIYFCYLVFFMLLLNIECFLFFKEVKEVKKVKDCKFVGKSLVLKLNFFFLF